MRDKKGGIREPIEENENVVHNLPLTPSPKLSLISSRRFDSALSNLGR